MKDIFVLMLASFLLFSSAAFAKIRNLNSVMAKATPEETANLTNLLKQVTLTPIKDPHTGRPMLKVSKVQKDSFWEKQGLKEGDLLSE